MQISKENIFKQLSRYPGTRYMGSKEKLLPALFETFDELEFDSSLDLMSGTGVVSYLLKSMGKQVISNDYMHMNHVISSALIKNNTLRMSEIEAKKLIQNNASSRFVSKTFDGLYYDKNDSEMIDNIRNNINDLTNSTHKNIALTALIRSCIKKRPRGIFAYTGLRYNDGRKDLRLSINEHFLSNIEIINRAIFTNKKKNKAINKDCMEVNERADLVYIDPPYFSPLSDNEYVRRYHFVEGIACNWKDVNWQTSTKTKKFKSYPSPFSKLETTIKAFDTLIKTHSKSHIVISYSSNALPKKEVILKLLKKYKNKAYVKSVDYRYSFSNQGFAKDKIKNKVSEYIFVGTD
tara:strand:+ start:316 stop:1362 length:1047 start_codon:yes stop_codon:yes gene_type:complete